VLISHYALGTPYPQDRTGIYIIPLAIACLILGLKRRPRLAVAGAVLLFVLAIYSTALVQSRFLYLWRYDAGTGRVYRLIEERAALHPGLRVGHDWRFEPTLNYYNRLTAPPPFEGFDRSGPHGKYDLYYLEAETYERWSREGYQVVYTDPVSGAVLLEPTGK
jgi:hypothetical protein